MRDFIHTTVLREPTAHLLAPRAGGVYVDGTVGGGGHTEAILEASQPDGTVIAIDRDPAALDAARAHLARFGDRVRFVHGRFGEIATLLADLGAAPVDGIVLDLGVSSPQLDEAERGFSFAKAGPIDMRMDPTRGETALELIRRLDPEELQAILRELGEERYAARIARAVKDAARDGVLGDTADLAGVVEGAVPAGAKRHMRIHPATRTFQALRIAVNAELDELDAFLDAFPDLLAPGGRCAVISFHSLEDRRVKRRFRDLARSSSLPPHLAEAAGERVHPICTRVTRKAVKADEDEVAANPRARSARLRVCEKAGAP